VRRLDSTLQARRRISVAAVIGVAVAVGVLAGCGETVGYSEGNGDKGNGKQLFLKGCGSCHTLADAATVGHIGPDLDFAFVQSRIDGLGDETIQQVVRDQIAYAVENPPTEQIGMPKDIYTGQDAEDVATYVASVAGLDSSGEPIDPMNPPTTDPGNGTGGKALFASLGCTGCHTLAAAGSTGSVGPDLDESKPSKDLVVDRVTNGKGGMPSFGDQLNAEQIDALAEYVSSSAGK
jgi:mono/diheme cytochrome c family protein